MRCSDEIKTSILHLTHLSDFGSVKGHSAQYTIVVMHAGTIKEQRFAIQHKTVFSIVGKPADTIADCLLMDNISSLFKFSLHLVAERIIRRPQMRMIDDKRSRNRLLLMGRYTHHHLPRANGYHCISFAIRLVADGCFNLHHCLVCRNLRGSYNHTVLGNVQGGHRFNPHVAIDTRAGIPAAVGQFRVIYLYQHLIQALVSI